MKTYRVSTLFPDLAASHAEQSAQVKASNIGTALRLALSGGVGYHDPILKRPGVKGRHIYRASVQALLVDNGQGAAEPKAEEGQG